MIPSFNFVRIPNIIFGPGKIVELFGLIPTFGKKVLFVIGAASLVQSGKWDEITRKLEDLSISYSHVSLSGEPSPTFVDESAEDFRHKGIDLVVGIGGGSVTDAGKAISAMIPHEDTVKNYLEGVGTKTHNGKKIPYVAIPTTSGTGSEATKNAVISEVGSGGFKKSLRHNNLIPNIAIIDPELITSCPLSISAACGMDAFTQLIEAFVSSKANPITDALALSGMKYMKDNLIPACTTESSNVNVRAAMAFGSLMSGIVLANAGLGIIHGLASPIGGLFKIPHGVVCGTLLAEATKMNISKLYELGAEGKKGLMKYAQIGALIAEKEHFEIEKVQDYCSILTDTFEGWTKKLKIDRLGKYRITTENVDEIVNKSGLKNNPVNLSKGDIKTMVLNRI